MPFADHKFVLVVISLVLIISLCQRSNHIAANDSASPPWREVEMCNHDEDGKTLSLYHDAKLQGTSTLMHVADLFAGSCEWVRVLDSGTYFTGSRDPKTGRIALHNVVRLPPLTTQNTVEEKHEETSSPDKDKEEKSVVQKLSAGSVSKDKTTTGSTKSTKPVTKQQKSTSIDSTSLLKYLTQEEAQQRDRIRTKVWNTNSVNVHLMLLNGEDDGVSDLDAEHFGVIPANEEAYFVFPMNRTLLATREDDPQVVITQFHHNGSKVSF
jgi:hypothetical protein